MSFFLSRWAAYLAGIATILLWQAIVKGRAANWFYAVCLVADVAADLACRLWIDISSIWRRKKKKVRLDEFENRLS